MTKILLALSVFIFVAFGGCKPKPNQFTINLKIPDGGNQYLKIIDMTSAALMPDSVQLSGTGEFTLNKLSNEPADYIFYIHPAQSIRIVAGVNETILVNGSAQNLTKSYVVSGSPESEQVAALIKRQYQANYIIDTLQQSYLKNQLKPDFNKLVLVLNAQADSIFNLQKQYLTDFIKAKPASLAAYVALSQQIGYNSAMFNIASDFDLFATVDTALARVYPNTSISRILSSYVAKARKSKERTEVEVVSPIGTIAPEIRLPNVYGDTFALSSLKGKYVLVDFWASWCAPCRTENANLRNVYRRFNGRGFEIFQVAIERNKEDWKNSIREDKLYWKYQVSELNYMESQTARDYKVSAIPANFLIAPDGTIIAYNLRGEALVKELEKAFAPNLQRPK